MQPNIGSKASKDGKIITGMNLKEAVWLPVSYNFTAVATCS